MSWNNVPHMPSIQIKIFKKTTPRILRQVNHLLSQLSLTKTAPTPLTHRQFKSLLGQRQVFFLTAMSSGDTQATIIGFLVVYLVRIPSGLLAVAEDLIIDEPYRKWGVGRLLMEYAIDLAERKGARHISLRTNPVRKDANRLYEQMGFRRLETNVFRINLPRKK